MYQEAHVPLPPLFLLCHSLPLSSTLALSLQQIGFSIAISLVGYLATYSLIPIFAEYTLKRGLSGKDLGKKGSPYENKDVPEALGLVCGLSYIVCTILSQIAFAKNDKQLIIFNSALFSICFMIFLGFIDDTLDLKWRYKLILPTISSLPLLITYSGSTAMYIPEPFSHLFMHNHELTYLGQFVNIFAVVDTEANGKIIELDPLCFRTERRFYIFFTRERCH